MSRRAAAAILAALAGPAAAEVRTLSTHGAWSVHGGLTTDGTPTCAIASGQADRVLFVQWLAGQDHLAIRLRRDAWRIPAQAEIRVRLTIGRQTWLATAASADPTSLYWLVTRATIEAWEPAMRHGAVLMVEFLTGSEPPWLLSLSGSNAAMTGLAGCMRAIVAPQPTAPSQPFTPRAPSAPSQPHRRT